ncbi:hypothetical protein [Bacteroides sedimenti]
MRYLVITIMLLLTVNSFGQVRNFNRVPNDILKELSKMGLDNSPLLNEYESAYFNVMFKDSLNGFDFTNKKTGFLTGSTGRIKNSKENYFYMQKEHSVNENSPCDNGALYIFNAAQKAESGGYDAAIVYWCKFLLPVDKVVKRLKNKG